MRFLTGFAGLIASVYASVAPAAAPTPPDLERGKQIATTVCAACHGADGKAVMPIYPHLAGQYANYLEHALREYRSGARKNPVMGAQAATLTDDEIHALAAYFSAQSGPLHTPDVHATAPKAAAH